MLLAHRRSQGEPSTLLQGMCQEPTPLTTWPSLGPSDRTNLTPHPEMGVAVVEVAVEVVDKVDKVEMEVAEERHHLDPEEQDTERLSLPMWITNCTARALTFLQGISERQESLLPSGTSTGVSTSTRL